jgi:hypothetical protein
MYKYLLLLLAGGLMFSGCQAQTDEKITQTNPEPAKTSVSQPTEPAKTVDIQIEAPATADIDQQTPPSPPLFEDFQSSPKLSLFPRVGSYRPADDDAEGLQFWQTYITHLMRTSGPLRTGDEKDGNIAFSFRAVKGLDSVGMFAPIAVKPNTTYAISATFKCNLEAEATAGIGILEFNKFLWLGEQYPKALATEHQVGNQPGVSLTGKVDMQDQKFTITTGPKTEMIHVIFFREGAHDRNPVVIDNIGIKQLP